MTKMTSAFCYLFSFMPIAFISWVLALLAFPGKVWHWKSPIQGFRSLQESYASTIPDTVAQINSEPVSNPEMPEPNKTTAQSDGISILRVYKNLYHKLQNLEEHLDIIPQALDTLISLFSSAIKFNQAGIEDIEEPPNIFSLSDEYGSQNLRAFLKRCQNEVFTKWEQYIAQREAGSNRMMFAEIQSAREWLKQMAPLKLVDGAWLGYINRAATSPFHFSEVNRILWQILSEEYGDGDLKKHHVHVYRQLLQAHLGSELPGPDSPDFIDPSRGLSATLPVWRAAVGQLLISLFAHDFFPEVLGFNLHFEGITLQTLIAAKELGELDMDPSYFHLHVSIDNADSGHSAMAIQSVERYLAVVESIHGPAAAKQDWRRIKIGFALSQYLCDTLSTDDDNPMHSEVRHYSNGWPAKNLEMTEIESRLVELVRRKCISAEKLHCSSRARIGDRMLNEWLDPEVLSSRQKQFEFVRCLADARWWVRKGDSANSRLVKELSWGGRMFGSFTNSEVDVVRSWIESLDGEGEEEAGPQLEFVYWSFSRRSKSDVDRSSVCYRSLVDSHPESSLKSLLETCGHGDGLDHDDVVALSKSIRCKSKSINADSLDMTKLLPLWFVQISLLQSLICIPARSATPAGGAVLRILRAQEGFGIEGSAVAGTDETTRKDTIGVLELGVEMAEAAGLVMPGSLADILKAWPSKDAVKMLHLAALPKRTAGLMIGITWAFIDLRDSLSCAEGRTCFQYLSQTSHEALQEICRRERESLAQYVETLERGSTTVREIRKGYAWGRRHIQSCIMD